jgi:hypothetical protein
VLNLAVPLAEYDRRPCRFRYFGGLLPIACLTEEGQLVDEGQRRHSTLENMNAFREVEVVIMSNYYTYYQYLSTHNIIIFYPNEKPSRQAPKYHGQDSQPESRQSETATPERVTSVQTCECGKTRDIVPVGKI